MNRILKNSIDDLKQIFSSKSSKFKLNALKLVRATIIGQSLNIISAPIISRLYSPNSIGVFTLFTSISLIITVVMCLRYELAIVLPEKDEDAVNILTLSIFIVFGMTLISFLIVVFFGKQIGLILKTPEISLWLYLLPLSLLSNGIYNALNFWNTRINRFELIAISRVSQTSTGVLYKIFYGYYIAATSGSLIIGQLFGNVCSTLLLLLNCLKKDFIELLRKVSFSNIKKNALIHKNFPLYSSWSAVLNNLSRQIPTLLLAVFFNPAIVGFYALGFKFLNMPLEFVNQSVSQVFYQRASEIKNSGKSISTIYWKMVRSLFILSLLPTIALALLGKQIFSIFLGTRWAEAGVYVQILSPMLFFRFISTPVSTVLQVYEKQRFDFLFNIVMLILTTIAIIIGGILNNPVISISGLSISLSVSYVLLLFIQIKVISQEA